MEQKNLKTRNRMIDLNTRKKSAEMKQLIPKTPFLNTPPIDTSSSNLIERTFHFLTKEGKKNRASCIFRKTMLLVSKKMREGNLDIFTKTSPIPSHIETHFEDSKNPSGQNKVFLPKNGESLRPRTLDVYSVFSQSVENVKPVFEVKKIRIAGSTRQVPALVSIKRQESIALRWIIQAAKDRKKKNGKMAFEDCFAFEILEAYKKQGNARVKRDELHKIAEANRAFAHYKWW